MKMKRSEKLGMLTGLAVGLILLLISVLMSFQTTCKVWGNEDNTSEQVERSDGANSFRYHNGNLITDMKQQRSKSKKASQTVVKPSNATLHGIDVSNHNGKIDWEKVKNSGQVDFAIIRCGYGGNWWSTDANNWSQDDLFWEYNSSECERLGIPYGTYLYSYADTVEKARSEAEHVVRVLNGKKLSYPIYYDMEENRLNQLSTTQIANIAKTFLTTMESYGYKNVAVYSSKYLFENKLTNAVFSDYPKWVAQYNTTCTYRGNYHMWQYTSEGAISGINGNVDLNYKIGNWNSAGYTPVTTTAKATTTTVKKTTVTKPKATTIKSLKKSGKKAVKITYKKVSGVSGYQIYMSTKKKAGFKKIATLSSKKSSYTKGKLKKGKKYYFKVRTMKKVSGKYRYSSFSKVRSIKR